MINYHPELKQDPPRLAAGRFTCAWHDVDADLLADKLEVKHPPLPDGRATPTRQGQVPEMGRLEEA